MEHNDDQWIPVTRNGETHIVRNPEARDLRAPADLDLYARRALVAIVCLVVVVAIAGSTVAIGRLLSVFLPPAVAYSVAGIFDASWIACMLAEWLLRHERGRSLRTWLPRLSGWVMLTVSVSAIATEATRVSGVLWIGVIGGMVSVLAKALWAVVMTVFTPQLSPLDRAWYAEATSAADAQVAMTAVTRRLTRTQAQVEAERAALGMTRRPEFAQLPETPRIPEPPTPTAAPVPEPSGQLPGGIVSAPVPSGPAPVSAPVPPQASGSAAALPRPSLANVFPISSGTPSVSGVVREAVASGIRDKAELLEAVRAVIPNPNEESARRIIRQELAKAV